MKHLDGQPSPRIRSLEELVAHFKPFRAPPPPQPFPDQAEKTASTTQKSAAKAKPKQKTFTATITVTESTDSAGRKHYTASSSPITRLPEPAAGAAHDTSTWTTRRERMRKRHHAPSLQSAQPVLRIPMGIRGERIKKVYAISVKRQRKLKMKKHKYKKLMKRTRTLRRKLERN